MKANAPEKLYISSKQRPDKEIFYGTCTKVEGNDIEYIRKDTFIEKACEFLKSYRQDTPDGFGYIAGIVNDKTIEDFRKYMKAIKQVVIPKDKMKRYMEWCKGKTSTVFCDCGKMVEVSLTPYCYDEEENDVYFASLCPECGELIITKE